jgi:hypothetical protein
MSPHSASEQRSGRADGSHSLPYHGLSTLALGFFGVAVITPFALAVDPIIFFRNISVINSAFGIGLAGVTEYILGRLTDNGRSWPQLPAWVGSVRTWTVSMLLYGVGLVGLYFSIPSWIPTLVISGMHTFAVGSIVTLCLGSARSGVWAVRQAV